MTRPEAGLRVIMIGMNAVQGERLKPVGHNRLSRFGAIAVIPKGHADPVA
jgi:hypothetical protein